MTKMTEEIQRVRDELAEKQLDADLASPYSDRFFSKGWNSCYEHMEAENKRLREALEFCFEITELAYYDHLSAFHISGSGFDNKAQYKAGHNKEKLEQARQALKGDDNG